MNKLLSKKKDVIDFIELNKHQFIFDGFDRSVSDIYRHGIVRVRKDFDGFLINAHIIQDHVNGKFLKKPKSLHFTFSGQEIYFHEINNKNRRF